MLILCSGSMARGRRQPQNEPEEEEEIHEMSEDETESNEGGDDSESEVYVPPSPPRPPRSTIRKVRASSVREVGSSSSRPGTSSAPQGGVPARRSLESGQGSGCGHGAARVDSDDDLSEPPADLAPVGPFFLARARSTCPHCVNPPHPVDYSSGKTKEIRIVRYDSINEPTREPLVSDARFFTMFHIDYYNSVILNEKKANHVLN